MKTKTHDSTPSKAFQVITEIEGAVEGSEVEYAGCPGANIQCVEKDFQQAIRLAEQNTAKDGKIRWVELRQNLKQVTVAPRM